MENYNLTQTGPEVQEILDNATPQSELTAETQRAQLAEQTLQGNIDAEAQARANAISAETQRAQLAEQTLQTHIDNEALTRENADTLLQTNIGAEETRAKAAEKQNADDIDALEALLPSGVSQSNKLVAQQALEAIIALIPSAASALNKLADKAFVNSSIATNTATFRGTFNLVSDLHLPIDANHETIALNLLTVTPTADNNDFCYVQIPDSAETPTVIASTDRYKFNGTEWAFEYTLNTSGFTAAQWASINSGITAAILESLTGIPALIPSEATDQNQLADKAYVLTQILLATPAFKGQFTTLTQLQAVTGAKAGDIGIVRTKDTDGHDVFTFYQYKNDQWNEFYTLSYHPQDKPATTGLVGEAPYNGMGRVELPMNWVEGWPNDTWLYYPYNDVVYLMYYWNGLLYAPYNSGTQEGLGLDDNLVVKPLDYNIADIEQFVGERYLPFTESSGVWTITKPDDSTITSTELNNTNIYKINDPTHLGINVLTQAMLNRPNTIYVIQHDYDLNGQTITVPENCILEFEGGSLKNGTIIGQDTVFINVGDVDIWGENLTREGSWKQGGGGIPDKEYDPETHSGLGRKTLQLKGDSNILTQEDFPTANTIYVIAYDFELGEDITVPDGCVLEFDGGTINGNYTITGSNTGIEAGLVKIFSNIVVSGSWNVDKIHSDWCDKDTIGLRNLVNLSSDDIYNIIYLKGGNYIGVVDEDNNLLLELKSNTVLEIDTTIELQTNGLDRYSIISVGGKKNVSIVGSGIIKGDADTHTAEGEGFCNGITIWESENVKIEGLVVENCFTDCIYVGGDDNPSKNIRINDCQLKESRRQGVSICNCVIFDISNCVISDISGTEPERCIDIEPNENCSCKSGIINNNHFNSNRGIVCNGGATGATVDGIFIKNNIFNTAEYALDNVFSNNIYIDKNIINSGSISINSGTNIHISNNTINCQDFRIHALCLIVYNKITANIYVSSSSTELKDNNIHGSVSFGTSDIRLSSNMIYNNIIYGDLFVNSLDGEICNNILQGKIDIRQANSIHNNQFIYTTRTENDRCLTAINVKCIADNLFNTFNNVGSQDAQSLSTFISITAPTFATVLSGNTFINQNAQLSQYFNVIGLSSNTIKIFAYDNICSEEDKTYGDAFKIFGTIVRYKNRGAVSELPSLPITALGNIYWDKDNNKPLFKTNAGWVDATGTPVYT